jgi:hypothetical protein
LVFGVRRVPAIAAANMVRTVRQERERTLICRTAAKEAASCLSPALLFWETYMQASCQSDEIAQHADFKGFLKISLRQGKQLPCEHPESRTAFLRISSQSERP